MIRLAYSTPVVQDHTAQYTDTLRMDNIFPAWSSVSTLEALQHLKEGWHIYDLTFKLFAVPT